MKPREFWIKQVPKYDPGDVSCFETEVAMHEPDFKNVMWKDFEKASHVIDYSAYKKLESAFTEVYGQLSWMNGMNVCASTNVVLNDYRKLFEELK